MGFSDERFYAPDPARPTGFLGAIYICPARIRVDFHKIILCEFEIQHRGQRQRQRPIGHLDREDRDPQELSRLRLWCLNVRLAKAQLEAFVNKVQG